MVSATATATTNIETQSKKRTFDSLKETDHIFQIADKFCRNFKCCSKHLNSLHELLEHYETNHVNPESDYESSGVKYQMPFEVIKSPYSPAAVPIAFCNNYNSMYEESAYANYDGAFKRQKYDQSSSHYYYESTNEHDEHAGSAVDGAPGLTVAPSCLTSDEDDILEYEKDPELAYLKYIKQLKKRRRTTADIPTSSSSSTTYITGSEIKVTPELKEKVKNYHCLIPGCIKVYRNQNGLKYHIEHSHTPEERELAHRLIKALKEDPTDKPYACTQEGCTKRYRNSNGLKYHLTHHHGNNGSTTATEDTQDDESVTSDE